MLSCACSKHSFIVPTLRTTVTGPPKETLARQRLPPSNATSPHLQPLQLSRRDVSASALVSDPKKEQWLCIEVPTQTVVTGLYMNEARMMPWSLVPRPL